MSEETKGLDIELLKKFNKLEKAKAALKNALDRIDSKLEPMRETVTDQMIDAGINNMNIDGRTIYVRHDIWAKLLKGKSDAIKALKAAEMEGFVSEGFNHQTLSAFVREKIKNGEPLPRSFEGIIDASHVYKARSNKG